MISCYIFGSFPLFHSPHFLLTFSPPLLVLLSSIEYAIDPKQNLYPNQESNIHCANILKHVTDAPLGESVVQLIKDSFNGPHNQVVLSLHLLNILLNECDRFFWNVCLNNETFILSLDVLIHKYIWRSEDALKSLGQFAIDLVQIWSECFSLFPEDYPHLMRLFSSLKNEALFRASPESINLPNIMLYKKLKYQQTMKANSNTVSVQSPSPQNTPKPLQRHRSKSCFDRIGTDADSKQYSPYKHEATNTRSGTVCLPAASHLPSPEDVARARSYSMIEHSSPVGRIASTSELFPSPRSLTSSSDEVGSLRKAVSRMEELISQSQTKAQLLDSIEYSMILVKLESIKSNMNSTISTLMEGDNPEVSFPPFPLFIPTSSVYLFPSLPRLSRLFLPSTTRWTLLSRLILNSQTAISPSRKPSACSASIPMRAAVVRSSASPRKELQMCLSCRLCWRMNQRTQRARACSTKTPVRIYEPFQT